MISGLSSHHSAQVTYKKSLPKTSSIHAPYNFKGGGLHHPTTSRPKISSSKYLNQINTDVREKTVLSFQQKIAHVGTSHVGTSHGKTGKPRSCQNSSQKLSSTKIGLKTLYAGSSTQRTHNSTTIKRPKKQLQRPDFEYLGTETRGQRQKNFFYEGSQTQKFMQGRWGSKQLPGSKKSSRADKDHNKQSLSRPKASNIQSAKWNQANVPYKWNEVIDKYPHYLTRYQLQQIKQYKHIYYIGHKVSRCDKQKNLSSKSKNSPTKQTSESFSFDNNQNEYVYELHDHVAYRYEILQKMGKGSYGEVLKVFDHKKKEHLALKIVRNKTKFNQQAFVEIQLLTHVKEKDADHTSNIVKIKDFIIFRKHVCIVFQLLSQNLYELIIRNNYNGLSPQLIRRFAIQLLTSLQFLRQQNIIHCDLKPENILLRQFNKSGIKIIDLGSSCFKNETRYTYIQSRYYRAPEITMGIKYSFEIDMWSTGCILGELFTGIPLFPGENQKEQMKYFVKTLGRPDVMFATKGERCQLFFDNDGMPHQNIIETKSIQHFELPLNQRLTDPDFCDFITGFLKWNPKQRFTPVQAMNHRWIRQGLPPEISKILPRQQQQKKPSRSQSRRTKTKSQQRQNLLDRTPQKQEHEPSSIRIKRSSKMLSQKSRELKN